jgi:uncharacterized tellurite resistance protein B-like protein
MSYPQVPQGPEHKKARCNRPPPGLTCGTRFRATSYLNDLHFTPGIKPRLNSPGNDSWLPSRDPVMFSTKTTMRFLLTFALLLLIIVNVVRLTGSLLRYLQRHYFKRRPTLRSDEAAFLRYTFCMLALMAKADGRVNDKEIALLEDYMRSVLRLSEQHRTYCIESFRRALNAGVSFETYALEFYQRFYRNPGLLYGLVSVLSELAQADGTFGEKEEGLLNHVISLFQLSRNRFASRRAPLGELLPNLRTRPGKKTGDIRRAGLKIHWRLPFEFSAVHQMPLSRLLSAVTEDSPRSITPIEFSRRAYPMSSRIMLKLASGRFKRHMSR